MRVSKPVLAYVLLLAGWALPLESNTVLAETADDHWWDGFGVARGFNDAVNTLAVFRGELIAGGPFTAAGTVLLDQIARWDGEEWHQLGGGIDHLGCPGLFCFGRVNALTVYNGDLIVGGKFWTVDNGRVPAKCVARWDGLAWHAIGGGIDEFTDPPEAEVFGLTVFNGLLVAGGRFTHAEGRPVNHIAYWDGYSWRSLGGGVSSGGVVGEFITFNGDLVVVGRFDEAGGVPAKNIARWDGVAWHPLGEGSAETSTAVTVYNAALYASGKFRAQNGTTIWGLGRWDGVDWSSVGTNDGALALSEYNNDLVACSVNLMRWNGSSWLLFGSGLNATATSVAVIGTSLYVGGKFTTAGGKPSARIARWDDVITPVAVQDLRAVATPQTVVLSWHMPSWWETRGISVKRAESMVGPYLEPTGSLLVPQEHMIFTDGDVRAGTEYWYRLVAEHQNGETSTLATLRVSIPRGFETALLAPVPIEGGRRIELRYHIGQPATPIRLQAYDVRGTLMRSLDRGVREPGEYSQVWDCRTDAGIRLPRGLYIIRLQAGQAVASRKVVVTAE